MTYQLVCRSQNTERHVWKPEGCCRSCVIQVRDKGGSIDYEKGSGLQTTQLTREILQTLTIRTSWGVPTVLSVCQNPIEPISWYVCVHI